MNKPLRLLLSTLFLLAWIFLVPPMIVWLGFVIFAVVTFWIYKPEYLEVHHWRRILFSLELVVCLVIPPLILSHEISRTSAILIPGLIIAISFGLLAIFDKKVDLISSDFVVMLLLFIAIMVSAPVLSTIVFFLLKFAFG